MDDSFDDSLENIVTVRPRLKKEGNSKKVPSSTKKEIEQKAEREDVVIENVKQKIDDEEKNTETGKMFRIVADMMEKLKVSINEKIETSERRVMKKMEENTRKMELRLDSLKMSVRRMEESLVNSEEKSRKPEELKKASNVVESKVKSEVEVSQEQEQDCESVEVIPVRQEVEKYLGITKVTRYFPKGKNRARKRFKVDDIRTKSGAEIKLSDRRVELRGTRVEVEKAKEMVNAICKETVVIHMEGIQIKHFKRSGEGGRIQDATGASVEFESKAKKGRSSPVCICGTREEVAAARYMLEQNMVTETETVTPEVMKLMGVNNNRVHDRIQRASGAFC